MKELTDLDKLRILLPHWIEHNTEHASEFLKWAESAEQGGYGDIAEEIRVAAGCLEEANKALSVAMEKTEAAIQKTGLMAE